MGRADYLRLGDWNAICDECGRKFKASDLRLRWDGFRVCNGDWEPRHPQDFVRDIPNIQTPVWTRPQGGDVFVPGLCSAAAMNCIAGWGLAGCMIAGLINGADGTQ